jgi:hypothetical protein
VINVPSTNSISGRLITVLTEDYLIEEYVNKKRFAKDIAIEVGCSTVTVWNYLHKFNIPTETRYDLRPKYTGLNPARNVLTKEYLLEEYVRKQRSMTNIAKELSCSSSLVSEMIERHGIKKEIRRSSTFGELNGTFKHGIQIDNGYLIVLMPFHHKANHDGYVRLHVILAEYYFGIEVADDEVVHHKNENKQDNRKCNLVIMKKIDHDKLHAKKRWAEKAFRRNRPLNKTRLRKEVEKVRRTIPKGRTRA